MQARALAFSRRGTNRAAGRGQSGRFCREFQMEVNELITSLRIHLHIHLHLFLHSTPKGAKRKG
jgi:hypothetical protein